MSVLKRTRNGKTDVLALNGGGTTTLGRGPECQIVINDIAASRQHCQLIKTDRGFLLRDLSSGNGTVINGQKVSEHMMKEGDTFSIGAETFQYSEKAGTGTGQAPAVPAKSGNTARVTAVTTKRAAPPAGDAKATARIEPAKPTTQRITTAAPAAHAPAKKEGTQRITTSTPKPTTQRVPAAEPPKTGSGLHKSGTTTRTTKKGPPTSRKISAAAHTKKYQKDRSTFSMPKTRKGKIIAGCVVLGIFAAVGLIFIIGGMQDNPKEIKERLQAHIDRLTKMPDDDPIAKDDAFHEVLNASEDDIKKYKKYALKLWNEIGKAHESIHERAELQKKANVEIKPWVDKFDAAKKAGEEDLKAQAQALWDEGQSLKDKYASTNWGEKIREILLELKGILDRPQDSFTQDLYKLKGTVKDLLQADKFVDAFAAVEAFAKKWPQDEHKTKVESEQKSVASQIKSHAEKLVKDAKKLAEDPAKKEEAKAMLRAALPKFGDLPWADIIKKGIADIP